MRCLIFWCLMTMILNDNCIMSLASRNRGLQGTPVLLAIKAAWGRGGWGLWAPSTGCYAKSMLCQNRANT